MVIPIIVSDYKSAAKVSIFLVKTGASRAKNKSSSRKCVVFVVTFSAGSTSCSPPPLAPAGPRSPDVGGCGWPGTGRWCRRRGRG